MFEFIPNLFKKQNQSVLGIDIGSSAIKVVQLRRKNGRAVLETYGELSLGPYANKSIGESTNLSEEKIIEALGNLLKEKEVNITSQECGIAIPFASSLMSVIELPQVNMKQIATMVPLEARKYIPVPISEVSLDWSLIPADRNTHVEQKLDMDGKPILPKLEVLIVAIHNDTIKRYKNIVSATGPCARFSTKKRRRYLLLTWVQRVQKYILSSEVFCERRT
jgi:Tfp pilus assembly PilM family ATPase